MTQQDLFNTITCRARTEDPDTSHEAARILEGDQSRLKKSAAIVVSIIEKYGEQTDFQIREHWPEFFDGKWSEGLPRMARLWAQQAGKIKHQGFSTHNGRKCRTWVLQ